MNNGANNTIIWIIIAFFITFNQFAIPVQTEDLVLGESREKSDYVNNESIN